MRHAYAGIKRNLCILIMDNTGKRPSKYSHTELSETFSRMIEPYDYSPVTKKQYNVCFRILCCVLETTDPVMLKWHMEMANGTIETIGQSAITESQKTNLKRSIPTLYKVLNDGVELTAEQKEPYVTEMKKLTGQYLRGITIKKANERLPLFSDFMENVKGIWGEDSQEYLLISLYHELTCRDDFSQLLISPTYKASISRYNYIVVCDHKPCEVVLNNYKTSKKYGPIRVILSAEVSNRIKAYIQHHSLEYGHYLFPHSSLSRFVGRILERCGLKGSISTLRRMIVSEYYNDPEKGEDDFESLAKRMGHSQAVAGSIYHRANV